MSITRHAGAGSRDALGHRFNHAALPPCHNNGNARVAAATERSIMRLEVATGRGDAGPELIRRGALYHATGGHPVRDESLTSARSNCFQNDRNLLHPGRRHSKAARSRFARQRLHPVPCDFAAQGGVMRTTLNGRRRRGACADARGGRAGSGYGPARTTCCRGRRARARPARWGHVAAGLLEARRRSPKPIPRALTPDTGF